MRKNTRAVRIGGVTVGGGNPVAVQSMLNVPIHDIAGNVAQAKRLEAEGCQIVRVTVPSVADVPVVEALKNAVKMPVVADIHFDYKVALACAEAGVDMIPCRIIYKGGKMRVFGRCTVVFGKPIPAEKLKLGEPRSAARLRECKALLAEELEKLLEENRQYL